MTTSGWTEERVELLRKLWTEGHSASQIAAQLGGVTRNAVIGKVHRLGLSGRGKSTRTTTTRTKPQRTAKPTDRSRSGPMPTMGNTALKMDAQPNSDILPAVRPLIQEVEPVSKRANIMMLTERTCKWPIGDPTDGDFHYCGNESKPGTPYCTYHARIAYQPVADRRQKRTANG